MDRLPAHPTPRGVRPDHRHRVSRGVKFASHVAVFCIVVAFGALLAPVAAFAAALTYSTYNGGSDAEGGRAIRVDGAGNIYVAIGGPGTGTPGKVVKYSPDGQTILYTAPLG